MKKIWLVVFFALLGALPRNAHAWISNPLVGQEKTVLVHFSTTVVAGATSVFDLVSLGNSGNVFPHTDHGELDVSHVNVMIDKIATSTGTVKLGVVNFVNQSTGSATFYYDCAYVRNVTNNSLPFTDYFTPAFMRGKVLSGKTATNTDVDGLTPFIASNEKLSGVTALSGAALLQSPVGFVNPRAGDLMMQVVNNDSTNSVTVQMEIYYHSEP